MKLIMLVVGATLSLPVAVSAAQDAKEVCTQSAPYMRDLAKQFREALILAREAVPEGIESDAMNGQLDTQALRTDAIASFPAGLPQEFIDGLLAAASVLPHLTQATERLEIAASALEACAE